MGKVYIISGDDDFSRKKRAKELALQLGGDEPDDPGLEIITADNDSVKLEQLALPFIDSVRTPPFLSPHKLVWLRSFPDLEMLSHKGLGEEMVQLLCEELPDDVDIIIDGPGFDQRKSYAKALKNAGVNVELFQSLKHSDKNYAEKRRSVLASLMESGGKQLEPAAAQYLLDTVGGSVGNLANEVEKLLLYTGDRTTVVLEDCEAVSSRTPEAVGWEFTAAVTAGDVCRALKLLDMLFIKDGDAIALLASLGNEYQRYSKTLLAMRELGIQQASPRAFDNIPEDVKNRFPDNPLLKMHPFRAFKVCEGAQRLGGHRLAAKLGLIRSASCAVVSGSGNTRMIIEQLILKLAQN